MLSPAGAVVAVQVCGLGAALAFPSQANKSIGVNASPEKYFPEFLFSNVLCTIILLELGIEQRIKILVEISQLVRV